MKYLFAFITVIFLAATLVGSYVMLDKWMYHAAVNSCYQAGRIEFEKEDGSIANTPDNYWFRDCMNKKGYKIN